ncbi:MAG: putative metal-binding motif-containing protein [Myxococcota bacterium]
MRAWLIGACLMALSCDGGGEKVDTGSLIVADGDGDGVNASDGDCDDDDPAISPNQPEICDGLDNDCDGLVDEDVTTRSFADADGDGFGDPDAPTDGCGVADGYVSNANDCDDTRDVVFPGNAESCDLLDNDCDEDVDEGVTTTFYADEDADGFGDGAASVEACAAPDGHVIDGTDCDDADTTSFPGGVEVCDEADNDCNGDVDEGVTLTWYQDIDGDNFGVGDITTEACTLPSGYAAQAGDCDDRDVTYHPDAVEDDCTDPNDYNCDGSVMYADVDADGWAACQDCDDSRDDVNPDQTEICNEIDDDCDDNIDDADDDVDLTTGADFYADTDRDGFGDAASTTRSCAVPSGYSADDTDCDDARSDVNPDRTEICNDIDDDCDDNIDDDDSDVDHSTGTPRYRDADEDGYGDAGSTIQRCDLPVGYVDNDSDCDDGDETISPVGVEVCDDIDNDCDDNIDDDDEDVSDRSTWYYDADDDGYGNTSVTTLACDQPSSYVGLSGDCNDGSAAIKPGATEICNDVDDDCDALVDDDDGGLDRSTATTWYYDADNDNYGRNTTTSARCDAPSNYVRANGDCDDSDRDINPGAAEVCDGADNDCDSSGDEGLTCSYRLVRSDLSSGLCVDDDVYVNVKGTRVYTDRSYGAQCGHVVSFTATPGDNITIWAVDSVGGCRNISDVYIYNVSGGVGKKLANGFSNRCGYGASSSAFWTASVSVPGLF